MYYFAFNLLFVWLLFASGALLLNFILIGLFASEAEWCWGRHLGGFQSTAYILFYATQIADWSFLYVYFS